MGSSENRRKLWAKRFKAGFCVYCGKQPFLVSKKGCKECLNNKSKATSEHIKRKPERQKLFNRNLRKEVIDKYGSRCACCNEENLLFLTIDHVNNDGGKERQKLFGTKAGSTRSWYQKLKREPVRNDLQVLCFNCNLGKVANGGICPHEQIVPITDQNIKDLRNFAKYGVGEAINWPSDDILIKMCNETNVENVAKELGIHGTSIRGRLKRRNKYNLVQKKAGVVLPGISNPSAKLTAKLANDIREKYQNNFSRKDLAKEYKVCKSTIDKIVTNKLWKNT
ncbi:MAG: hypothetical protein ACE5EJ_03290 [Nitrosopumilaceae archaeon]